MYSLDVDSHDLINDITLEVFELSDYAYELLLEIIDSEYCVKKATNEPEFEEVIEQLHGLGVAVSDIRLSNKFSFTPQTPIVHVIKNCNSPCIMCDCWKTKEKTLHSAEALDKFFGEISKCGAVSIMVSGGEPTLHPELIQIIDSIHKHGMSVQLNTNGINLDKFPEITDHDVEAIIVSMDGFNSENYAKMRGIDRFNKVCDNILEFRKNNLSSIVGLRVTLTKYTLSQISELVALAKKLGVDSIGFSPLDATSSSFAREMSEKSQIF
ncbi:MAG: radical SAM protein [Candidatus Ancillula sp.]|jgi:MoaA/NifB/PqqE/SkfB family radical SAM enzyme|nr:radical SAM protein [Candidatus Ancillula sp.]